MNEWINITFDSYLNTSVQRLYKLHCKCSYRRAQKQIVSRSRQWKKITRKMEKSEEKKTEKLNISQSKVRKSKPYQDIITKIWQQRKSCIICLYWEEWLCTKLVVVINNLNPGVGSKVAYNTKLTQHIQGVIKKIWLH